jgi:hypothetical protein
MADFLGGFIQMNKAKKNLPGFPGEAICCRIIAGFFCGKVAKPAVQEAV